jgi:hypothetical protein
MQMYAGVPYRTISSWIDISTSMETYRPQSRVEPTACPSRPAHLPPRSCLPYFPYLTDPNSPAPVPSAGPIQGKSRQSKAKQSKVRSPRSHVKPWTILSLLPSSCKHQSSSKLQAPSSRTHQAQGRIKHATPEPEPAPPPTNLPPSLPYRVYIPRRTNRIQRAKTWYLKEPFVRSSARRPHPTMPSGPLSCTPRTTAAPSHGHGGRRCWTVRANVRLVGGWVGKLSRPEQARAD